MNKLRWLLVSSILFGLTSIVLAPSRQVSLATAEEDSHLPSMAPGVVLVQLKPGVKLDTSDAGVRASEAPLRAAFASLGVRDAEPVFRDVTQEQTMVSDGINTTDLSLVYRLHLAPDADVLAAVQALNANPMVVYAEPDYLAHPADTTPNDPLFSGQWGFQTIQASAAWDVDTGNYTVAIAIVDSGIDTSHPDLSDKLWINPGEIPANGIDDDNNGFVDDVNGWDFVGDDNDPSDDHGHGTQVAGIASADTNNGAGIAGACWGCRIMPVKVMQVSGVANYSDIAAGVLYAAQKGAKVINISLGGYSDSATLRNAIQTAADTYGAVIVAGAGNDGVSTLFYPAAYTDVIAVAGTTITDTRSAFSNYGAWVDVSAPAVGITTTLMGGDYGAVDGTSYAAPFVSGVAGLIRSQHPGWSGAMVRAQVIHTADSIDSQNPGYEEMLGEGRLNAAAAMTEAPHPLLTVVSTAVNGDPLGRPAPDDNTATLAMTLCNDWQDAAGVSGALSTTDPDVTLVNSTASYGTVVAGGTGTSAPVYLFTVSSGAGYNHPILFNLTLTANGGAYTTTIPFTITTRSSDEPFCGTIVGDTTWTNDKTYIINCNVGIAPGITLTIQPGTVVRFNGNYSLNVGGTLIADGTETQPIRFMSNIASTWERVYFDSSSVDATTDVSGSYLGGNILRWVRIESAGQGVGCNNATPYISHVTVDGGGVNCIAGSKPLWLLDSDVTGDVSIGAGSGVPEVIGAWTTRASMPTARQLLGVAGASNGKLYAIGGYNGGGDPATVEEYDPATDTWIARASMLTGRYGLGVAAANSGKIYAIGGLGGMTTVEEYSPVTDTWTTKASMPTARWGVGVVATSNGKVYAIGGHSGGSHLATVEEYDPATDTWTTCADMPTARGELAVAATSDGRIYAIGGDGDNGYVAAVEEYDPATDTWTPRASMPAARSELGIVEASNGKIYAIGGCCPLATVEEYDPITDIWAPRTSMSAARGELAVAITNNGRIYAVGGGIHTGAIATVEEFTVPSIPFAYRVQNTAIRGGNLSVPGDSRVFASTIGGSITAGSGSVVQSTTANGGITFYGSGTVVDSAANGTISLDSGTVRNNAITGGGINIGSGAVLTNTLEGGGISAGSGSTVRGNDVENASGWGIEASNATIAFNRVVGNASGINAVDSQVSVNLIANSAGVGLQMSSGTVTSNTLTGNGGNAIVIASGAPVILNNNLEFNYGAYDLVNNTANPISATHNWLGTTASGTIDVRVYDYFDDFNLGQVTYTPVLTGPVQDAPAYVRAVTLTPGSPVGIETVAFDVLFSRAMDQGSSPLIAFGATAPYTSFVVSDNTQWRAPNLYRATFDITSLIPRNSYGISVNGAVGADGIEIATDRRHTFTVDYAGAVADVTPPPAPTLQVDFCLNSTSSAAASWLASDPDSAITLYRYALGTSPGGTDVINWTNTIDTSVTRTGLTLVQGQQYYFSVKARNEGGLWSESVSDSLVAGVPCQRVYLPLVIRSQ